MEKRIVVGGTLNEKSSFTADGVAFRRTFTNIPYSVEIFDILQRLSPMSEEAMEKNRKRLTMTPFFEARYLMTDRFLKEYGIRQVLEIASGLSPRGFIMSNDRRVTYVEMDLPEKMAVKRKVVEELSSRFSTSSYQTNLFLEEGNVLKPSELLRACSHFGNGKMAIVAEGLLRYISLHDKMILTKHITSLLMKHGGGVFITPDIETKDEMNGENAIRHQEIAEERGFDILPNLFQSRPQARAFFQAFGFDVKEYPLLAMIEKLSSPSKLGLSQSQVEKALGNRTTFVMTLK